MNKYIIFKTKFYLFYPIFKWIHKNPQFLNHKYIHNDNLKIVMNKYLFILPIYDGNLEYLNTEHLWCKEWIKNSYNNQFEKMNKKYDLEKINKMNELNQKKNMMMNDLHHLFSANLSINALRKSYKLTNIQDLNKNTIYLNKSGKNTNFENYYCKINKNKEEFEPPYESKSIIIRSFTYLLFKYPEFTQLNFSNYLSNHIFLNWFYLNKVDYTELYRNELIYLIQKNYNPFICYPLLIPLLFDDSKNVFIKIIKMIPNQLYCIYTKLFIKLNLQYYKKNKFMH
jgi:endonuclease I